MYSWIAVMCGIGYHYDSETWNYSSSQTPTPTHHLHLQNSYSPFIIPGGGREEREGEEEKGKRREMVGE